MCQSISTANERKVALRSMQYRTLGRTQLTVSIIGFGASVLGGMFGATEPLEGKRAVHLAIDHGVNFFDVSPYCGLTLAEERLGEALDGRRQKVILATKWDGTARMCSTSLPGVYAKAWTSR